MRVGVGVHGNHNISWNFHRTFLGVLMLELQRHAFSFKNFTTWIIKMLCIVIFFKIKISILKLLQAELLLLTGSKPKVEEGRWVHVAAGMQPHH